MSRVLSDVSIVLSHICDDNIDSRLTLWVLTLPEPRVTITEAAGRANWLHFGQLPSERSD